jgi:hypothetical protein
MSQAGLDLPAVFEANQAAEESRQLVLAAALGFVAIGTVWAVLRSGSAWPRLVGLALTIPVLATLLAHVNEVQAEFFQPTIQNLSWALATIAALMAVSLLPARFFGWRLARSSEIRVEQ